MQEPWFYCPSLRCGDNALDEAETRHASQSRRLRPGDTLTVFDGAGHVAVATLSPPPGVTALPAATDSRRGKRRHGAIIHVAAIQEIPRASRALTLVVPACKGARLDWLVEKCTELGVTQIILAEFERSVVHAGAQHVEKLSRTAIEACKQCRRAWLPHIEAGVDLAAAAVPGVNAALLVAHRDVAAPSLAEWLARGLPAAGKLTVVIGPEGGLSPPELDALHCLGAQVVCLAEHVLRIETAAIAVAAIWAAQVAGGG